MKILYLLREGSKAVAAAEARRAKRFGPMDNLLMFDPTPSGFPSVDEAVYNERTDVREYAGSYDIVVLDDGHACVYFKGGG
jgi:hypothetical protein